MFNEYLAERVRDYFKRRQLPTEEKRMMGGLCFMVREKMAVGVDKDRLMVRFDPEREAEVMARPGAAPMDFTGRPMRGFVFVSADGWDRSKDLAWWLDLALDFNPKAKASKRSSPRRSRGKEVTRLGATRKS